MWLSKILLWLPCPTRSPTNQTAQSTRPRRTVPLNWYRYSSTWSSPFMVPIPPPTPTTVWDWEWRTRTLATKNTLLIDCSFWKIWFLQVLRKAKLSLLPVKMTLQWPQKILKTSQRSCFTPTGVRRSSSSHLSPTSTQRFSGSNRSRDSFEAIGALITRTMF